ncbi:MAG TPA: hypothetical protein EYH34_09010 [Planctomycetes bacterium]|nr:hypothetical protein [Planctomycetota bacterium]
MFRAIARYFRALGYLLVGKIDAARTALSTSPTVVRATYDAILREKKKRIQQYKDAVAGMIAQEEKKKAELRRQSDELARLEKLKEGAAAMARRVVEKHGGNVAAIKGDPDYMKCQAAFKDFNSTIEEKEARVAELEEDIRALSSSIAGHKIQLETLHREIEQIRQEREETVADIITAREEKELADMIAGISEDRSSQELQELRELRQRAKAGARVARELAGTDAKRTEEEFLEYATRSSADTEFDRLIGLAKESSEATGQREEEEGPKLPES